MERENRTLGPWEGLQRVLEPKGKALSSKHHPSRRVLRAYLSGALPDRPARWTVDRAQALVEGRLSDWTTWEVAAHLSICSRCHVRIKGLERQPVPRWRKHLTSWHERIRQPHLAPVGWALAGAQALIIVGLVCWLTLVPGPTPKTRLTELSNETSEASITGNLTVQIVQFQQDVPFGELIGFLKELGVEDLAVEVQSGQSTLRLPIMAQEALEESPYVMSVENPERGDGK